MTDYNCSIYIPQNKLEYAHTYLFIRDIKYKTRLCSDGLIEISVKEKFSKVVDNLAKRCYN